MIIKAPRRLTYAYTFAWMEVTKAMAALFRIFDVRRSRKEPTSLREGFFVKSAECWVSVQRRA